MNDKKITLQLFEKIVHDLYKKKYHICRELDENGYIKSWIIFNQDMALEDYFSPNNEPLLSSKNNNIFDLIDFIKEHKMSKLSKEAKKILERELRQYKENKQLINKLKIDDNISTRVILICLDRIKYVENVFNKLNPFEKQVFEYIFYKNFDSIYCESYLNVSKSTYYNIYNKCINFLAEEWGEI